MDGYIVIKFKDRELALRYTQWAVEKMDEIIKQKPDSLIWKTVALIAAGYFNGCRYNKVPEELTLEDIDLIVDEYGSTKEGNAALLKVLDCYTNTYVYKALTGQLEDEESKKKKQTGKK